MRPSSRLFTTLKTNINKPIFTTTTRQALLTSKMSTGIPSSTSGIPSSNAQMSTGPGSGVPSQTAQAQHYADTTPPYKGDGSDLGIQSRDYSTAAGVNLSEKQKVVVGSVLDLFAGHPTLPKLSLWTDTATFADPLTIATGRKQYSAQWYGLAAAFSSIQRLSCTVKTAGNPIEIDMKTRYKVKGLGTEKEIESLVKIWTDDLGERIVKVEDRWNGEIPEGAIAKAFRNLNSVTVPAFVSVPKNEQEEAEKNQKK